MSQSRNLNEECLLQYLSGQEQMPEPGIQPAVASSGKVESLAKELKRIHRRDCYVSFPPAILVRRQNLRK